MKTDIEKLKSTVKKHGTNPDSLFRMGEESLLSGDYKEARMRFRLAMLYNPRLAAKVALSYERVLDGDTGNINARLSLADLHLYLGEIEGAIGELDEILDIAPDRVDVYNMLGSLYLKKGDTDSAISVIEAAFRSAIKDTSLVEMLAGAYIEKGRIADAISLYKNLVGGDPANKNYLRVLGELETRIDSIDNAADNFYAMVDGDPSSATEVIYKLEELKKKQPGNIHVRELLASVYVKAIKPSLAVAELESILSSSMGHIDRIIIRYKDILDKYPDEPSTLMAIARALIIKESYSEAVDEYRKLMKYSDQYINEAISGLKDILSRFPGQLHAHETLGDAYLRLGSIEECLLEYLEVLRLSGTSAKNVIEKCLKISKENQNMLLVHQVLGQAYIISGDGKAAIEEAEFMIYLDKNNAAAHQIMGDAFMKMKNLPKAQASYASALSIDPFNVQLHKRNEDAGLAIIKDDIEVLKKRADEDPWRLGTHLDIAKLYLMSGDFDKGVKELQIAVKDTARAPFAYNLLGMSFIELGRFDLAASQFERALETLPKELSDVSKSIRFNLGASYEAMGNVSGAIAQYETVLSEDVSFANLQPRISNLSGVNPESLRNKMVVAVIARLGEGSVTGMWGPDFRHRETSEDLLNISFGQEHNSSGFDHFIKGRLKGATEEFSLAVQLDPKLAAGLNNLAVMMMIEGRMEPSQTRLSLALTGEPDSAVLRNNMGVFHYLKKDHEAALLELNRAIQLDPNLSAAYINLGDVMYLRGSAQLAISLWEKIKANDILSPLAARRLSFKTVKT